MSAVTAAIAAVQWTGDRIRALTEGWRGVEWCAEEDVCVETTTDDGELTTRLRYDCDGATSSDDADEDAIYAAILSRIEPPDEDASADDRRHWRDVCEAARELAKRSAEYIRDCVDAAAEAAGHAEAAADALDAGDLDEAIEELDAAARIERTYGDDPIYGPALRDLRDLRDDLADAE